MDNNLERMATEDKQDKIIQILIPKKAGCYIYISFLYIKCKTFFSFTLCKTACIKNS